MADLRIETERLILRDWRGDADWAEFFRVTNTPAVMEWLGGVLDENGQAKQRERVEGCAARNGFCFWAMERKADAELLGFCGLKLADAPGSSVTGAMEIGWRMREDAWGKGYAKEAAAASLDLAFDRFGADEVIALTVNRNEGSWGLMKRLGMRRREDLDFPNSDFDADDPLIIVYSIASDDWRG